MKNPSGKSSTRSSRVGHIERYLPFDVVTAARQRIQWCYEAFDCPIVCFSGGKDSLAVLLLTVEMCQPLGIRPHVVFFDEEFVPSRTLNFVKWVFYESKFAPLIVPHWLCWQMESEIYCAGESAPVIQWGRDRKEWLREPPRYALMDREHVYDIFSPDVPLAQLFPGRSIVTFLGTRTAESMMRLLTILHSANSTRRPCFVRQGKANGTFRAAPLYDWATKDVLKFLGQREIINPIYYEMMATGRKTLRTDTPLHGRKCNIAAFKKIDPPFFDKLCRIFPEVHAAALYNEATKPMLELVTQHAKKYGRSWEGLYKYIQKELKPDSRERAEIILRDAAKRHASLLRQNKPPGIPLLRVWKLIVGRKFDHPLILTKWSKAEYAWEKKTPSAA